MVRFSSRESIEMDVNKLFEKVMSSNEIAKIPLFYVFVVMNCVLDAIGSGECFYETEID